MLPKKPTDGKSRGMGSQAPVTLQDLIVQVLQRDENLGRRCPEYRPEEALSITVQGGLN